MYTEIPTEPPSFWNSTNGHNFKLVSTIMFAILFIISFSICFILLILNDIFFFDNIDKFQWTSRLNIYIIV